MSGSTLFIAPPGARGRTETIFREIVSRSRDTNFSDVLYLGPDAPYLTEVRRRFYSYVKQELRKTAYIPFESHTIKQLAISLHQAAGDSQMVSDEIRTLILLKIVGENNLGYATLLSELYSKIKHHIVDRPLDSVKEDIGRLIFEDRARERALESMDILIAYEGELRSKQLTDSEGLLRECPALVRGRPEFSLLVLDGFLDPTPLETEIIRGLIDNAGSAIILAEENTSLAGLSRKGRSFEVKKLKAPSRRTARSYFLYPSIEEEVEGIVKSVKKLLMDGMQPWEVTVSFPELSKYAPMITRVCKKHGVPVSVTGHNTAASQPLIVLQEFITCIEEDYPRNDFLSLLTSPFTAIPDVVKEWAVSYSYRAGIIQGKEAWLAIEYTLNNESRELPEDERGRIAAFQEGIKDVIAILESVRQQRELLSFIDAFESALSSLGYLDAGDRESMDVKYSEISSRLSTLFSEARQFASLYNSSLRPDEFPGFYLRYLLEKIGGTEAGPGGVRIVPFPLAAAIEAKELFFGGMIEGDFPSKPGIDPILPEQVKKTLGLPYLEYYLVRQKKYFDRLLNISERAPRFSCPAGDGEKIFLPSSFLDWEQKQDPIAWQIYSEEEVLVRDGARGFRGTESKMHWDSDKALNKSGAAFFQNKFRGYINVTDIDYCRKCPFRFYIEKVLGLEIEEPPRYEVEARLWGSLAHKAMEHIFRPGDIEIEQLEERLFEALEAGLQQFPVGDFWLSVARDIFKRLLPGLKELETERKRQGYSPLMIEQKLSAEINGIKLKGKIDRVDVKKQRSVVSSKQSAKRTEDARRTTHDADTVILLDYKTGTIDRESLQLPLYALMWREQYSEPIEKVGYYSLKEAVISWYPGKAGMDEYLSNAFTTAEALVRNMRDGYFPADPFSPAECRYCGHGPLCKANK